MKCSALCTQAGLLVKKINKKVCSLVTTLPGDGRLASCNSVSDFKKRFIFRCGD